MGFQISDSAVLNFYSCNGNLTDTDIQSGHCLQRFSWHVNLSSNIFPSIDLSYIEDKYSGLSTQALLNVWSSLKGRRGISRKFNNTKLWVPTNPRGAERLPPGVIVAESDFYTRRLWGLPSEMLANVVQLTENFTILLFHYDGRTSEWDEFEWSKRAIHVSVRKQTKWWYAKRFLHPDIVAPYDYIFIWDEDLGVDNFDPEEYIKLVKKHGLDISQPGLSPDSGMTWQMTRRREDTEVHKDTEERPGWCTDPHLPPCAAVFSRRMALCLAYDSVVVILKSEILLAMLQNDLVHGWGLDFALRKCVEPAHEKIGVVDSQWIVHQTVPSLGNQGKAEKGKAPWEGVRERCRNEWTIFQDRLAGAEKAYFEAMGIDPPNSTAR
ncbi:hypothetical protein DH2020_009480 [Rehmannia glutinosa]|uniref:Lysine ketoglutarate reductase trans-splicing-like protein n=1 Tax=Rehmannia glutinosa TaxID=99300 RepID=A0ABR0X961_REHGL